MTALDTDIVVVGFGPVGATVAALAARRGLGVVVLERDHDLYALPRAAHCDHEVLRILQEVGCLDDVLAGVVPNVGMDFLTAQREVLLQFRTAPTSASGWPASVFFHQPSLEAPLRRAAIGHGAQVRLGVEVVGYEEHADHVVVALADGGEVAARCVVACDGARSTSRRLLGTALDDLEFDEPWLVVDLVRSAPVPGLPDRALQVCDPARPHTVVPMPWPRFRFEFMLLPGEEPDTMQDPKVVRSLLAGWLDPDLVDVERAAVYRFHGLIAREWRSGRVVLAGDAAHQMPPFLGQGMCSGMRDAVNLVWKLDAWIRGGAPETLLDTYQREREPHVRGIVEAAVGFGRLICTLDPVVAELRDAQMLANRAEAGDAPDPSPPLLPGPLVGVGGGSHSRQVPVDGVLLDDVVGPRFAVVTAESLPAGPLRSWWESRACLLDVEQTPALAVVLGDAEAVVIRPDRIVLGAGPLAELTAQAVAALEA